MLGSLYRRCRMDRGVTSHIRICCERQVGRRRQQVGAPTARAAAGLCGYCAGLVESGRVTRRAPPLESISRYLTTERTVHRPISRWAVISIRALILCGTAMIAGCKVLPEYEF